MEGRTLTDKNNMAVVYHNPLDNVELMADIFFERCLLNKVTPFVVTKKTVFKWQEEFWNIMKNNFDKKWKSKFNDENLLEMTGGKLQHMISDNATMQILRWNKGGFGLAMHN